MFTFLNTYSQEPLFRRVLVSDTGVNNTIGNANTSRNLAITNDGTIYAVFVGSQGIRVSKSTDRGMSFLPSIQISPTSFTEPEIAVNSEGIVFVSWIEGDQIFFSRSTDNGQSFSNPINIGIASFTFAPTLHMTTFGTNVYIRDVSGTNLYVNKNNGLGSFTHEIIALSEGADVFADVRTDINGVLHLPSDDPVLYLFNSNDEGNTIQEVELTPRGSVFFSSYALSDSPSGTFIFVAGNGNTGYKIEADTGTATLIDFKPNDSNSQGRTLFADNFGALVDGYLDNFGNVKMSISYDQGISFDLDISIDDAISHSIDRNPLTDDLNVIYERNGQIFMNVYDGLLRSVRIVESTEILNVCQGDTSAVSFTLSGAFLNNSEFFLFLSDENGSFENKAQVGFIDSTVNGDIQISIPQNIPSSNAYRLQIQSPENFLQSNIVPIEIGSTIEIGVLEELKNCDSGNGSATFNLSAAASTIPANTKGASVAFFKTENEALSNTNPITNTVNYTTSSSTVWLRLDGGTSTKCDAFNTAPLRLSVIPLPNIADKINDFKVCDDLNSGSSTDGFTTFNLNLKIDELLQSVTATNYEVALFNDISRLNKITTPNSFTNTLKDRQTIYATITSKSESSCFVNTEFDIVVVPPTNLLSKTVILKQCDDDADGISIFNLNEARELLTTNFLNEDFKFYTSASLAEAGLENTEIQNPSSYTNPMAIGSIVHVRIINGVNCFITASIELQVGVSNIPQSFFDAIDIGNCDDGNTESEYTDGITSFDFTNIKSNVDAFFAPLAVNTTFYESQENALSELNAIQNISSYRNTTATSQRIFVRVDGSINNDCQGFGNFEINVTPLPTKKTITNLIGCGTTTATFNLTTFEIDEIIDGQPNIEVSYYQSENDRNKNIPISNATDFTSIPRTIFVSALNTVTGCANNDMEFELLIDEIKLKKPTTQKKCSLTTGNTFNLTTQESFIANGNSELTFNYFENEADLLANNPITEPENYTSTNLNTTIIVQATNKNNCNETTSLNLETTLFAAINNTPNAVITCDNDSDGFGLFNLNSVEDDILMGVSLPKSDFNFKYYFTANDAENNTANTIPNTAAFRNSIQNQQNLFVRVDQSSGSCYEVISFEVKTIPSPTIPLAKEYILCADFANTNFISSEETTLPQIPINTNLSETDFSFRWFRGATTNQNNLIPLETSATYLPEEVGIYTVEVTDNTNPLACKAFATAEVISSIIPESIQVDQISDQFSDNTTIEITVVGNGTYEFSDDNENWQLSNRFSNIISGESTFYVRDLFNCATLFEEIIIVDYPSVITPNNDGFNDTWTIESSPKIQIASIMIFNRYGKVIKQLTPETEPWDGTYNGNPLPSDDYWFMVDYTDTTSLIPKQFKASFTLKR